jgi:hypothetical protein
MNQIIGALIVKTTTTTEDSTSHSFLLESEIFKRSPRAVILTNNKDTGLADGTKEMQYRAI